MVILDKFHEQLLRTKKSPLYRVLTVCMYISIVFIFLSMYSGLLIGKIGMLIIMVLFIGSTFLARFYRDKEYREYEYIFTNGNLQIDVIYNMKKRKTLFDVDVKDFDNFGKSSELKFGNEYKKVICVPWDNKDEKYVCLINQNGKKAVYIAPNEELLKLISVYNVRRPRV